MKIVVLDGYTTNPGDLCWDGLQALGELTVYERTPEELTIQRIGDAEIVYTNKTQLTEAVFAACANIKWVGVLATGVNVVDIDAAVKRRIPVCNVPAYSTVSVAQATIALLLELTNRVGLHATSVADGDWCKSADFCYTRSPIIELSGKTIGIFGYGNIGRATAKIAWALGMNVLAYSRSKSVGTRDEIALFVTRDELLINSDVISLHCPLTDETKDMIGAHTIAKMKDGVLIINTSRGALIDETALRDALNSGKIGGAGLDVVSEEPMHEDNPMLGAKNIVITPHIGWASHEARQRLMDTAVSNLRFFLDGKLVNVVNMQ